MVPAGGRSVDMFLKLHRDTGWRLVWWIYFYIIGKIVIIIEYLIKFKNRPQNCSSVNKVGTRENRTSFRFGIVTNSALAYSTIDPSNSEQSSTSTACEQNLPNDMQSLWARILTLRDSVDFPRPTIEFWKNREGPKMGLPWQSKDHSHERLLDPYPQWPIGGAETRDKLRDPPPIIQKRHSPLSGSEKSHFFDHGLHRSFGACNHNPEWLSPLFTSIQS